MEVVLDHDREWNQEIREGNDGGNPSGPHRLHWRQYREISCQSKTGTNINTDDFFSNGHVTISFDVIGLTSNQVSTTRVVSKCQKRWSDCFDTIFQCFEKKTEQSNSGYRCFAQNSRILSVGQVEHGCIICQKEEDLRRDFSIVWIHSLLIPSCTRSLWRKTHQSHIARQRVVTERLRRAHVPRWKLQRYAFDHSIWFDSGWQRRQERETCGVLYGPWTQCSSIIIERGITTWRSPGWQCTNTFGKYTKTQCIGVIWGLLVVKDCSSIKRDHLLQPFICDCIEKVVIRKSGEEL